jgi:hypothetical protein
MRESLSDFRYRKNNFAQISERRINLQLFEYQRAILLYNYLAIYVPTSI